MRLIDADELKKSVVHMFCVGGSVKREMIACIEAASTIEERNRGEWLPVYDENGCHNVCPFCGDWKYYVHQKFCGECGASLTDENLRGAE